MQVSLYYILCRKEGEHGHKTCTTWCKTQVEKKSIKVNNMGVQGTVLQEKAERSHHGQNVHHAMLRSWNVKWILG